MVERSEFLNHYSSHGYEKDREVLWDGGEGRLTVNFVIAVDHNCERLTFFIEKIRSCLAPIEGLQTDVCSYGAFSAVWAASKWAPISHIADDSGAAIVWGEPTKDPGSERVDAERLRVLWKPRSEVPPVFDGFYAAALYSPEEGLLMGVDILGIFPVYYYSTDDLILVGSSPELFRFHPAFRMQFNPAGLVGIFLASGLFDGKTLLQGVNRLGAGNMLVWRWEKGASEVNQYRVPLSQKYFDFSLKEQLDVLDEAIGSAVRRYTVKGARYTMLLSGGLDSRMVAGYLKREGVEFTALTDGLPTDIDAECAAQVSADLGVKHDLIDVGAREWLQYAHVSLKWEFLANGFTGGRTWGICSHLEKRTPRVIAGFLGDAILGGLYINWAKNPMSFRGLGGDLSFDAFFHQINRRGVPRFVLKKLLRKELFDDFVQDTIARVRREYESYSDLEFQRAWCFDLHHQERFRPGNMVWILSFGAWPVLPLIDRGILEVAAGLPVSAFNNRRLETELVCKQFPNLASLPLDRSSYDTTPLKPTIKQRLMWFAIGDGGVWKLSGNARHLRRFLYSHLRGVEPRYYYRVWDFNSANWRAIRREAEKNRELAGQFFDESVFGKVLPGPDATLEFDNPAVESMGLKCLIGFVLWLESHCEKI